MLLDDVLTGLDMRTAQTVCIRFFGPQGLLRKLGASILLATNSVQCLNFADQVLVLDPSGTIQRRVFPNDLQASLELAKGMLATVPGEAAEYQREQTIEVESVTVYRIQDAARQTEELLRKTGDIAVFSYYWKSMGSFFGVLPIVDIIIFVFGIRFPQVWVSWWTQADTAAPAIQLALYAGIYCGLSVAALLAFALAIWIISILIVPRVGRLLHWRLLQTAMTASHTYLTQTDASETLNRFSQDISLIDNELADSILTTLMGVGI